MTSPRFVFITGSGRCGSSLLQELLSRHEDVGFLSNLEDRLPLPARAGRFNNRLYRQVPQSMTRKGRVRFAPSEGWRALERETAPLVAVPGRSLERRDATPWLAKRVRAFFHDRAVAQGAPVFLHKFTGWPRTGLLDASLDDVSFIHVVRDGRAVANSLVQMPWWRDWSDTQVLRSLPPHRLAEWERSGRSFPLLAGLVWDQVTAEHERAREAVAPDRWLDVRYEDVVADPARALEGLLSFAGLKPSAQFDDQMSRQVLSGGRVDAFRRDLTADDLALLEEHLSPRLTTYGYLPDPSAGGDPLATSRPRPVEDAAPRKATT